MCSSDLIQGSTAGDAATIDGLDSSQFLRSDTADSTSGTLSIDSGAQLRVGSTIGIESKQFTVDSGIRELFRLGSSSICTGGIFTVSGTRNSFVHTSVWSWSTTHNASGRGTMTQLSGGEYSNVTFYLDIKSDGSAIISMNCGGSTSFQVKIGRAHV